MALTGDAGFRQGGRRDHKFSAGYPSLKEGERGRFLGGEHSAGSAGNEGDPTV
jgi:hypothetical protein